MAEEFNAIMKVSPSDVPRLVDERLPRRDTTRILHPPQDPSATPDLETEISEAVEPYHHSTYIYAVHDSKGIPCEGKHESEIGRMSITWERPPSANTYCWGYRAS